MIISINVRLLMEQSVPISSNTFGGTPFLEKGPPKITEGRPFVPRWLISRGTIRVQEVIPMKLTFLQLTFYRKSFVHDHTDK